MKQSINSPMMVLGQVDEAGLSANEFRILAHVCRRYGNNDNKKGCDASIGTIAATCRIHEDTACKALKVLIEKGWVVRTPRPGTTSLLTPAIPSKSKSKSEPKQEDEWGMDLPESKGYPSPENKGYHPPENKGYKGNPLREPIKGTRPTTDEKPQPTPEGIKFAEWFRTLLPSEIRLSENWKPNWAAIYDDMIRIDGRTKNDVIEVCRWARQDDFWSPNFLSPAKLRKRKDGVLYFDAFKAKMASRTNGHSRPDHRAAKASREYAEPTITRLPDA